MTNKLQMKKTLIFLNKSVAAGGGGCCDRPGWHSSRGSNMNISNDENLISITTNFKVLSWRRKFNKLRFFLKFVISGSSNHSDYSSHAPKNLDMPPFLDIICHSLQYHIHSLNFPVKIFFYPMLPYIQDTTALFECSRSLPAVPSTQRSIKTKSSMGHW
jgi:hypothetical protein